MNIHEYQAAEIFARYGIPTNGGQVATTPDAAKMAAETIGGTVVIKAQVHIGGRGKAGGIKLAKNGDEARDAASRILGMDIRGHQVNQVLVAPATRIASETYLGVTLDRGARQIVLIASAAGGVEIEDVAHTNPDAIIRTPIDPVRGLLHYQAVDVAFALGVPAELVAGFVAIATNLVRVYLAEDASLAEINPLARTEEGEWLAVDTKMVIDDNALFRHRTDEDLRDMAEENAVELEAKASGISFVQLGGTIGCVVNGAGLAMATMDAVKLAGGEPANFLDVGGGARADQVAKGLIAGLTQMPRQVPIVVRLAGTNAEEGRAILATASVQSAETMTEAAQMAVAAANR